jgi:hypothetical protein
MKLEELHAKQLFIVNAAHYFLLTTLKTNLQ